MDTKKEKELFQKLLRQGLAALLVDEEVTIEDYQYCKNLVDEMLKEIEKEFP